MTPSGDTRAGSTATAMTRSVSGFKSSGPVVRLGLVMAVVAVAAVAGVAPAGADRKPNDREREDISRVLNNAGFSCDAFPGMRCHRTIKVSTVNERWAASYVSGGPGVQGGVASLGRKKHRWRIHQVGNGGGCEMPSAVVRDLGLDCF